MDCNDNPINIGDTVRRLSDGETGVVNEIVKRETHRSRLVYMPVYVGDLVIRTSSCSTTISNNYKNWQVIEKTGTNRGTKNA